MCICFFKQKTAYEMRISDWSSDVCSSDLPDSYLAQYGCTSEPNDYNTNCPTYVRNASYGLTTLGNPDLKPEKSRSWTVGALIEPIPGVSFRSEEHTSELQSLMRISYAVFCLKKKKNT